MLNIDIAILVTLIFVIGYFAGVYSERKYGKKNRSAFPNMAVKRRR